MPREMGEKKTHFPDKEARYKCWATRDSYWECLDKKGVCEALRKTFEDNCPPLWVKHFDRKKEYIEFQEKMKEGGDPVDTTDS